ncbi:MAG: ATP-binding protein [Brevinematales bacterium]|nr:ATP-binding protein [Brevinematales bacterium]
MRLWWWFFWAWGGKLLVLGILSLWEWVSPSSFFVLSGIDTALTWGLFGVFYWALAKEKKKEGVIHELDEEISAWKHLLRESVRTQASLQQELEKWHEVIEVLPFPVILTDIHGKFLFVNRAFQKHFEAKAFCWEIPSYPLMQAIEKLLKEGGGQEGPFPVREKYYAIFVSPLIENRFLVIFIDRTEEIKREEREKEFIAYAAHELKTPLTAIQGYLEIMEPTITEKQQKSFQILVQHVTRLVRLSQDLLLLNRFELGPLSLERCDVTEIVKRIGMVFLPRFQAKGLRLNLEVPETPLIIEADPVALEEILVNLIENALRYTENGETTLTVKQEGEWVHLLCQDTGIGISERDIPHLFERFYVVDKSRSRQTGGTGLGLAIVKSLVLRHGGKVNVQSEKGKGSLFIVELPCEQKEKPA